MRNLSMTRAGRRQAGFGMIEVLAAVFVLAIGVVGFAALQMRAVQTSGDSYYRTQAMSIAQDLAERMRANITQAAYYTTATTWPTDAAVDTTDLDKCMTGACTTAEMAAFDALNVRYNAETLLPQGLVSMAACPVGTLSCIYVAWDGLQPTAGAAGECVNAAGVYQAPAAGKPAITCVMLEVQ